MSSSRSMPAARSWRQADRNGYFFVLDRTNGKFVSAKPFVSKTTWPRAIPRMASRSTSTPTARPADDGEGTTVFSAPSFLGGKNWMPMAYSQQTGLFYIPSNEWGMDIWNEPIAYKKGAAYLGAGFTIKPLYEGLYRRAARDGPDDGQDRVGIQEQGAAVGRGADDRGQSRLHRHARGLPQGVRRQDRKELWKFNTGSGVVGSPVTWEQDGEQYVAVMSGWGGAVPLWGGEVAKSVGHINQAARSGCFKLPKA